MSDERSARPPVLEVRSLSIRFERAALAVQAVDDVSFELQAGRTLALVGESGCGKSVTALSLLGLLPDASITGSVRHRGRELLGLPPGAMRQVRGGSIAMVFQDPMTSLNPVFTVGWQLAEALSLHRGLQGRAARARGIELLERVGVPAPAQRFDAYPYELSGGMRQRAMIALALAGEPEVLIADEPTTALDVTIQAQILDLIATLQRDLGMAVLLITHDLGVVAQVADDVHVMYAGRIVESGPVTELFERPGHGYTHGLLRAMPSVAGQGRPLLEIPGVVPRLHEPAPACSFAPRCAFARPECTRQRPATQRYDGGTHVVHCAQADRVRADAQAATA